MSPFPLPAWRGNQGEIMQKFGREKGEFPNKCGWLHYRIAENNNAGSTAVSSLHRPYWRTKNQGVTHVKTCDVCTGNGAGGSGSPTGAIINS